MVRFSRRQFLFTGAAAAGALAAAPFVSRFGSGARILVIGGGPGGVAAATAIRAADPAASVVMIERDPKRLAPGAYRSFVSAPRQGGDFASLAANGIELAIDDIRGIDWGAKRAEALSGRAFSFDRVVLAPGISMREEGIDGYDRAASIAFPHGWTDRQGAAELAAKVRAMADGGTVVIRVPAGRMRFPEGPYQRADEIATYLATAKPKARVVMVDESEASAVRRGRVSALQARFGDRFEHLGTAAFGRVVAIDRKSRRLIGENGAVRGDVINFIPAQAAGRIAQVSGLAEADGWCPVAAATRRSTVEPDAFLLGDAASVPGLEMGVRDFAVAAEAIAKTV
ncbi:FAD-dependent oxidoreductase [Rhodobium gokarnense]|uniref:NADPH-dependent 2,4-dienoyl-CoA reductase/sulfur reductase-like enzyme n=1 Tax=Rhodobium gokarnense TaxID=364296 RepID=A0ABT3H904_9HYPH|nr:FAD-dependent oxidoreductase [Rhodobium gokarnense]MCW2306864.1 NADPH-dependent 2,4-dienoyl-CoA reductase/sulfur reductase-like enzyme [Rhodobium gokarnense]